MPRSIALVYSRKSLVKRGAPDPASPEMQESACVAKARELKLRPELYQDADGHRSGANEDRPAWQKLKARLGDADVAALIVYAWSRAVRSTKLLLGLIDDCKRLGVRFISVSQNMDTNTADGRLIMSITAAVDESEAGRSSERRIETIDYLRRRKGRHYGLAPFGTVREKRGGDLVLVASKAKQPNGTDYAALKHVYEMYLNGGTLLKTARALNADGWQYRDRHGQLRAWNADDVRRCLASHWLYAGYVTIGRAYRDSTLEVIKGSHEAILPDGLTAAVAQRMAAFHKTGPRRRLPEMYPLSSVLMCECGLRLAGVMCDGRRVYRHYRQPCAHAIHRQWRADDLEQSVTRRIQGLKLPQSVTETVESDVMQILAVEQGGGIENERRRIEAQLERLKDLYEMGDVTREQYQTRRDELKTQIPRPGPAFIPESGLVAAGLTMIGEPAILRDMARALYSRIVVDRAGELSYEPLEWCKAWA